MIAIEIILIIVGMLLIMGSYWVTEKLSPEELEHISELSKEEMGVILEHELASSRQKVEDMVDETIDASKERTERVLEKQTNEKIIAINEYSDTVIEKMNKTHNEIMFLYSMLNDKHAELTGFSSDISKKLQKMREEEEEMTQSYLDQLKAQLESKIQETGTKSVRVSQANTEPVETVPAAEAEAGQEEPGQEQEEQTEDQSVRERVFELYREGRDSVHIAKKLGMGVGEVRLILGLYKGDYSGEV